MAKTEELIKKLDKAIENNAKKKILEIIKNENMDINDYGEGPDYTTPLLIAIKHQRPNLVKLFLSMGANPNVSSPEGYAIQLACETGNTAIIKSLLDDKRLTGVTETPSTTDASKKIAFNSISGKSRVVYHLQDTLAEHSSAGCATSAIKQVDNTSSKDNFNIAVQKGDVKSIKSLLNAGYIYDDKYHLALEDALKLSSFDMVKLLIEKGASISVASYEKIRKEQGVPDTFKKLLQLEKKKQIDMMAAFVKHGDNSYALNPALEKIKQAHDDNVAKLKKQHDNNIGQLKDWLGRLEDYVRELPTNYRWKDKNTDKNAVIAKIKLLQGEVNTFLDLGGDKKKVGDNISNQIKKINKDLGKDRKAKDILLHIAFACTGIGLLIMLGNKAFTGTFFLNPTKRQKMLSAAEKNIKKVMPKLKH